MPSLGTTFTLYAFNKYLLSVYYALDTTLGDEQQDQLTAPTAFVYL